MNKVEDITFHYTNEDMVKELLNIVPYQFDDVLLDPSAGVNKVFYNNFKCDKKMFCEIDLGIDFYSFNEEVDWIITNPPFHESWKFIQHTLPLCRKGFAYLFNVNAWNSLTPLRLQKISEYGFNLSKVHIVMDSRWFGRYYFCIFEKKENNFLTWNTKSYSKNN